MYLHLGMDKVITFDEIIGIFDLDTATVSNIRKDFIKPMRRFWLSAPKILKGIIRNLFQVHHLPGTPGVAVTGEI